MPKLVISMIFMIFTSLLLGLLGGCSASGPAQQTKTIPSAGTGALIDGDAVDNTAEADGAATGMIDSAISQPVEEERRYEYRSGR